MIDESMDIYVTGHLVIFASFVEEDLAFCLSLGLLHIEKEKIYACIIFETLTSSMKKCRLDFNKCVRFGSNGAAVMINK